MLTITIKKKIIPKINPINLNNNEITTAFRIFTHYQPYSYVLSSPISPRCADTFTILPKRLGIIIFNANWHIRNVPHALISKVARMLSILASRSPSAKQPMTALFKIRLLARYTKINLSHTHC